MKHTNLRVIVLLVLSLAMLVLTTSCGLKTWLEEKAPWVDKTTEEDSDTAVNGGGETPDEGDTTTTTKPADEPVPEVEHKGEMSDDDFIKGTWGDTSEN